MAENQDTKDTDIRLGFVDLSVFSDGSIRGGLLITDIDTRPYEFRATSPVKPTQLQRILYGPSLSEYVYSQLICAPLIKAAKEKMSLILVREPNLLAIRDSYEFTIPVILISYSKSIKPDDGKDGIRPVTISSHRKYGGEGAWAQTMLSPIMQRHDLIEPFERVHTALVEVHSQRIETKSARD